MDACFLIFSFFRMFDKPFVMTQKAKNSLEQQAKASLRINLQSVAPIDEIELDKLMNLYELVCVKKNQIIINKGEAPDSFYYIYKGIIRVYYYLNDKMVLERFEKENGFFGGNFSHLLNQEPISIYESVEDMCMLRMKYADLEEVLKDSHQIERLYRMYLEKFHVSYVQNVAIYKSLNSEERYREFINQFGDIANRVSLKDIANYLEMTPETLSRIRAKFDKLNKKK